MTSPDGAKPKEALSPTQIYQLQNADRESIAAGANADLLAAAEGVRGNLITGLLGMIARAITGGLFSDFLGGAPQQFQANQLAVMNDHSQSITTLEAVINALILQGNSTKFVGNANYIPTTGLVSVDVIILGAGGGGGGGSFDAVQYGTQSGHGGGGGGEVHYSIPSNLLEKNPDGSFKPIPITIGQGGAGATGDGRVGGGGGNTSFGGLLTAGGGAGGSWGSASNPVGGAGMIPGGRGGTGGYGGSTAAPFPATLPGNSTSAYDLHGGGGGGGAGQGHTGGQNGGIGGVSPGGAWGNPAQAGIDPSSIVATGGGGGGGGAWSANGFVFSRGAAGAYPSGGGGGGACGRSGAGGGAGGNGMLFVIERFA